MASWDNTTNSNGESADVGGNSINNDSTNNEIGSSQQSSSQSDSQGSRSIINNILR